MFTNPWKWFEDQEPRAKKIYGAVVAVLGLIVACFSVHNLLSPSAELRSARQHLKRVKLELDSRNPPMICLDIERLRSISDIALKEAWFSEPLELRIKRGNVEYTHGTHENALKQLNLALELAQDKGRKDLELVCLNNLGTVHLQRGSVGDALDFFKKARQRSAGNWHFRRRHAAALGNMGLAYNSNSERFQAMKHFEKALIMYKNSSTAEGRVALANSWRNLAMMHRSLDNIDAAIKTLEEAFHLFKFLDRKTGQAQVLADKGQIFFKKRDYSMARKYLKEAAGLHKKDPPYPLGQANVKNLIGETFRAQKDYAKALEHFNDAMTDFQRIKYPEGTASTLQRIALVFKEKKLPETAIEYLKEAERISGLIQGKRRQGQTLVLMSEISVENDVGSREDQEKGLRRALKISREIPVTEWEAKCLYLTGEIYRKSKKPKKKELRNSELKYAEKYYSEALNIYKRLNEGSYKDTPLKKDIAKQHRGLRDIYEEKGEIDRALEHAQRALHFARETEEKKDDADDFLAIGTIHAKRESPEAARPYFKLALEIRTQLSDTLGQADALVRMADTHKKGAHCTPEAAEHLQCALNTLEEPAGTKDAETARQIKERKADILVRLAHYHKESDVERRQEEGLECWRKACDIYKELGSTKLKKNLARSEILQGKMLVHREKEEQAIAKFLKAGRLAGQLSGKDKIASASIRALALVEIAGALRNKGLLEESKKNLHQASLICMSIPPNNRCEKLSFRIGQGFIELVNYDSPFHNTRIPETEKFALLSRAEWHLDDSLRLIHDVEMNYPAQILYSTILQHTALAHKERGSISKALQNFHAAIKLAEHTGNKRLLADQFMGLGILKLECLKKEDNQSDVRMPCMVRNRKYQAGTTCSNVFQETVYCLEKAREIYHELGDPLSEATALRRLALAWRAKGGKNDLKKAKSHLKKAEYIAYGQDDTRRKWEFINTLRKDHQEPHKERELCIMDECTRAECREKDTSQSANETSSVFQANNAER
jgi:tetratricopeptide (TPR) repeat protein